MKLYDTVIIGGGISGLYFALKYNEKYPNKKCCILESYKTTGGRIATSYTDDGQFERGAARFNNHHRILLQLIKKFKKTPAEIPSSYTFIPKDKKYKNIRIPTFTEMWSEINKDILSKKSRNQLINNTLYNILIAEKGKEYADLFLHVFNYHAEIKYMNAFLTKLLLEEDINPDLTFYYLKEGLQSLTDDITDFLKQRNIDIKTNHTVLRYHRIQNKKAHAISGINKNGDPTDFFMISQNVVFACNRNAIETIEFTGIPKDNFFNTYLNNTTIQSLHRIFALYPTNKNKSWFTNIPKIKTDGNLGFIIPSNSKTGLIQISYTDSDRSDYWRKLFLKDKSNSLVKKEISKELKTLFPKKNIPQPTWVKSYYWKGGGTYWNVGVDVENFLLSNRHSMAKYNLYAVGEAFSMRPAWIEGGLLSVEYVFDKKLI